MPRVEFEETGVTSSMQARRADVIPVAAGGGALRRQAGGGEGAAAAGAVGLEGRSGSLSCHAVGRRLKGSYNMRKPDAQLGRPLGLRRIAFPGARARALALEPLSAGAARRSGACSSVPAASRSPPSGDARPSLLRRAPSEPWGVAAVVLLSPLPLQASAPGIARTSGNHERLFG